MKITGTGGTSREDKNKVSQVVEQERTALQTLLGNVCATTLRTPDNGVQATGQVSCRGGRFTKADWDKVGANAGYTATTSAVKL